jgi:hypothetical protein
MKKSLSQFLALAAVSTLCFLASTQTASATVVGNLALDSGVNTATVSASSVVWNGPFEVSGGSTGTFAPLIGTQGDLVNLGFPPIPDFITFLAAPSVFINLTGVGPGSSNTNCATVTAVGESCSVFAGSPIVLTLTAQGTGVDLGITGTAHDSSGNVSAFMGDFSTTITTLSTVPAGQQVTPAEIQAFFVGNPTASITSPYSGTFVATFTAVPEPSAVFMVFSGIGLIAIAMIRRRRQVNN